MIDDYQANDRMADLIEENYRLLQVISRFGMSLGFGDKTVDEVCRIYDVDTVTFLAIINFMHSGYTQVSENLNNLSVPALINYLRQSHVYFLDYVFPRLRKELREVLSEDMENPINVLITKQFDNYMAELNKHMKYEDENLFPYVEELIAGHVATNYELSTFSKRHHSMDSKLRELKRILVRYSPKVVNRNELNAVLYQIYVCEDELDAHCKAEDYIFVPAVYNLEERIKHANRQ